MLPDYKFVVFLDADASFRHLNLPFEWLLNRWNVTKRTSFTMARDPLDDDCNLCDSNGIPMVNTGFVITQNLPYTEEIFDVWMKCTSGETKYKDCAKWKEQWAHEQAVMSDYLRYDYNPDGDNIRVSSNSYNLPGYWVFFYTHELSLIDLIRSSNAAKLTASPATCGTTPSVAMANSYAITLSSNI